MLKCKYYGFNFTKRLQELRKEAEVSYATMAKEIGISQRTIARWEKGITEPNAVMICKICRYFNVASNYLLGLSDTV
ncbi:MAG: helix-turn-helix domain-containing protein [Firmicutes bacterium]|nr:helix-turn-helix domain-containing protein [Bacillota bacterium]